MLTFAPASMFGALGDYADTLRNNETAAREHLLAFLNSWLTGADDWIVVTTNESGYGISMNRDAKLIAISAEAYKLINAAANNVGAGYALLDPRLESSDVTQRIALRNEVGPGRVIALLGTRAQVREMTQAYVDKLAAKAAAKEVPPPTTERYPNWRTWVAAGGVALLLGGGAYLAYRRAR